MRGHKDLRLLVAASAVCALLALILPLDLLRLAFALPLTLFLSGYAIAAATFARRPIDRTTTLILSVGISIAVLALGGLLLNYAGGLHAGTWALLLVLVVLAASRAAALRRAPTGTRTLVPPRPRVSTAAAAVLAMAALATVAAFALAFTPLSAKHATGYTELWLQPFDSARGAAVRVGIGSNEQERTAYRLSIHLGRGGAPATRRFALEPGESHVLHLGVSPVTGGPQKVVASLFRTANPSQPYRRASAWISPPRGPQ
ncbi:MAG: hypothetical protein JWM24_61 [Solirubrobacterales bacterium]|nr:hypothetical protein [Solirubrobacterales bacterium]